MGFGDSSGKEEGTASDSDSDAFTGGGIGEHLWQRQHL